MSRKEALVLRIRTDEVNQLWKSFYSYSYLWVIGARTEETVIPEGFGTNTIREI